MGILYAWAVKLSSWITILVTFALLLLPAEGHVGLWVGLFAVDVYLVHITFFHSAFSPADKIKADEKMFTSYSETALVILGMFSKNGLSFGAVSAMKSQGILLA